VWFEKLTTNEINYSPFVLRFYGFGQGLPQLSSIVDPNLGGKPRLAPGWKFRVQVLDQDLMIQAVNGKARIVQDDLENTYDACYEETDQKACSFKS
jgi:hypothetical protein